MSVNIEIIEARNLQSVSSVDAYCIANLCGRTYKSSTCLSTSNPKWLHTILLDKKSLLSSNKLNIMIHNEQAFFSCQNNHQEQWNTDEVEDECLGRVTLNINDIFPEAKHGDSVDAWYVLDNTTSGEVHVKVSWKGQIQNNNYAENEERNTQTILTDRYGFAVPKCVQDEWSQLESYDNCREIRRVKMWETSFGSPGVIALGPEHYEKNINGSNMQLLLLQGVPRAWRSTVYFYMSGAFAKQVSHDPGYYSGLAGQTIVDDYDPIFHLIEMDVNRTFSNTSIYSSTVNGKLVLRRILRTYALHNRRLGYCQGMNFITAFLMLVLKDEEQIFWILAVICEDLFPDTFIPSMIGMQRDLSILEHLIQEELPQVAMVTKAIHFPLEILATPWFLCLFTKSLSSEIVFRILDCLLVQKYSTVFIFHVILAHLRAMAPGIIASSTSFESILTEINYRESSLVDPDSFMKLVVQELTGLSFNSIRELQVQQHTIVVNAVKRTARMQSLNQQLAVMYDTSVMSTYTTSLLKILLRRVEESERADKAYLLSIICHGLVWLVAQRKN